MSTTIGACAAIVMASVVMSVGSVAAAPPSSATRVMGNFAGAGLDGQSIPGVAFKSMEVSSTTGAHASTTAGSGFLSIFQEASGIPLNVSVNGSKAVSMANGGFSYGLVPAGSYTITAMNGAETVASGIVAVPAGQDVTALIYLSVGGTLEIGGFINDWSAPPIGQARIVFRNAANVGPVDVYLNGVKVASSLTNIPSAPPSISVMVNAGEMNFVVTLAGEPENDAIYSQSGDLVAGDLLNLFVVGDSTAQPSTIGFLTNANPLGTGYRLYASDGGVFDYGNTPFYGSMGGQYLSQPVVGAAPTSIGLGYWMAAADGGVFSFGDAPFLGSAGDLPLQSPVVSMAATSDDKGYWLAAADGGVFAFGDANFYGSLGGKHLNEPIVGIASTTDDKGYWLVASDGGVFAFGDANYLGSTGSLKLNKQIVAIVPTVDNEGYWLVASDGGVFAFGDANYLGSTGSLKLNKPIVAAIGTPDSLGYWLIASDGGVYSFGNASFQGSAGNLRLNKPIVFASDPGVPLPT
jgi:uncharacterized protein DUF4397